MSKRNRHSRKSGECLKCGVFRKSLHRDHIIPRCKGGTDDEDNIQWLCANCHEDKTREDLTGFSFLHNRLITDEHRARLSAARRQRVVTLETKAKTSATLKGRKTRPLGWKHTKESRAKISAAQTGVPSPMRGYVHTELSRQHMSEASLGKPKTPAHKRALSMAATQRRIKLVEAELEKLRAETLVEK